MKILHFTPALQGGGIKTFICQLCNAQLSLGEEIHLCTIFAPKSDSYAYSWLNPSVQTHDLGKTKPGFSIKELFSIFSFVRKGQFDVVNLHGFFYYYILTIALLHRKVRFFYTIHNQPVKENSYWDQKLFFLKRLFFRLGWIHPITISKASHESFLQLYGCSSTLIYNGLAKTSIQIGKHVIADYKITPDTHVFVHVARISKAKNQELLCRVFQRLIQEGHNVVLLLIGQNQDADIFSTLLPMFSDRIQYLGEREDAIQYISEAEALCLPSLWEGMPITILEALSQGCPTIGTPIGGITDLIQNNYNGILSNEITEESYYNAVLQFINLSAQEQDTMRAHCLSSFEPFKIENTAKKYIETYHAL